MTLAAGNRQTQISYMLDYCSDHTQLLNEWENDFVESLFDQFERRRDLSDKQVEALERIYCKLP